MTDSDPREIHTARVRRFGAAEAQLGARSRQLAHLRLAVFAFGVACLVIGVWSFPEVGWVWVGTAGACLALFVVLVGLHDRVIREERRAAVLGELGREALWRLERRWDALPPRAAPPGVVDHPLARDLDLFSEGRRRASLFDLLGTAHTPMGRQTLADWLLSPAAPAVVRERQEAVRELAPQLDFREDLGVRGRRMLGMPTSVEPFLGWAEGEPWMLSQPLRIWIPRILGAGTVLLLGLNLGGVVPPWWLLAAAGNLLYTGLFGRPVHAIFDQVAWRERAFREFEGLFAPLAEARFEAPRLRALQARLRAEGVAAHQQMRRLDRILGYADARRTGLMYILVQSLTLWDFHVLWALSRWQKSVGHRVRDWFAVLGEAEALSALAALAHDEPSWCFPAVDEAATVPARLDARALGHPLLAGGQRVHNDVTVGPAGAFLLVTGSNMSGKSTLLRAIGVNAVLAQAGGPVCAEALTMPPVRLGTSFRVEDSLEHGVSFFMAELRRLKAIVDAAAADDAGEGLSTYLFLLDEILQGTNIYERQIAVRHVLCHLMERGAIGAISSHDLTLAETEGLAEAARAVHFTEEYRVEPEGPRMTFDYRLRPGVAPTTNALKLLALVGLGEGLPTGSGTASSSGSGSAP